MVIKPKIKAEDTEYMMDSKVFVKSDTSKSTLGGVAPHTGRVD